MVNVDSWKIILRCPKCGIKNKMTLSQVKKGQTIQCIVCATKINIKDENGRMAKETKKAQDVMDSLENAVKEIDGVLKLK